MLKQKIGNITNRVLKNTGRLTENREPNAPLKGVLVVIVIVIGGLNIQGSDKSHIMWVLKRFFL